MENLKSSQEPSSYKEKLLIDFDKISKEESDNRAIVALIRVSTLDQKKGYSLDAQKTIIDEYADEKRLFISDYYMEVKSAWSEKSNRKEYERLLKDIKANKVKAIIVWKSDRLTRRNDDNEMILKLLIEYRVKLISITEGIIDHGSADGRKVIRQRGIENQHESEKTSERVKWIVRAAAQTGRYPYPYVPLGFKRKDQGKSAALIIDESVKDDVVHIFEKTAETRWGIKKMVHWLNSQNYMNRKWHKKGFERLIKNPIYIGTLRVPLQKPRYEIQNYMDPLIKIDLWNSVQNSLNSRRIERRFPYLFNGMIRCTKCKSQLVGNTTLKSNGKTYTYYYCKECNKRVREDFILLEIVDLINIEIEKQIERNGYKEVLDKINKSQIELDILEESFFEDVIDIAYYKHYKKKHLKLIKETKEELEKLKQNAIYFNCFSREKKKEWLNRNINVIEHDSLSKQTILKLKK